MKQEHVISRNRIESAVNAGVLHGVFAYKAKTSIHVNARIACFY